MILMQAALSIRKSKSDCEVGHCARSSTARWTASVSPSKPRPLGSPGRWCLLLELSRPTCSGRGIGGPQPIMRSGAVTSSEFGVAPSEVTEKLLEGVLRVSS